MTPEEDPQVEYRAIYPMVPSKARHSWWDLFWARCTELDAGWFWGTWAGCGVWGLGAFSSFYKALGYIPGKEVSWANLMVVFLSLFLVASTMPLAMWGRKYGFIWKGNSFLISFVGVWATLTSVSLIALWVSV